jgi:hypothetical protein
MLVPTNQEKQRLKKPQEQRVIYDDQIRISRDGNRCTMDSLPLPARDKLRRHPETAYSLERIFMIIKDSGFFCSLLQLKQLLQRFTGKWQRP